MLNSNYNILILLKDQTMDKEAIEQKIDSLNKILFLTESPEQFCRAHELVDRNRITSRTKKILHAIRYNQLQPFRFLICKN